MECVGFLWFSRQLRDHDVLDLMREEKRAEEREKGLGLTLAGLGNEINCAVRVFPNVV